MRFKLRLILVVPALLLMLCLVGIFLTRGVMANLQFLKSHGREGSGNIVDQQPLQTAQTLFGLAVSTEEQAYAHETIRIADHEVDQAFAMALRALDELSRALHDASTGVHPLYIFCCASSCWESTAKVPQSMPGIYTVQNCNIHAEFQRMQTERSSHSDIFGCMSVEPVGHALLVCTFFVVLLTVLFNGGASTWMMSTLKLRAEDEEMCDCPFPPIVPQMSACPVFRVALQYIDTHSI